MPTRTYLDRTSSEFFRLIQTCSHTATSSSPRAYPGVLQGQTWIVECFEDFVSVCFINEPSDRTAHPTFNLNINVFSCKD
jgi:hypothetical protein